jgi:hypothetical protein
MRFAVLRVDLSSAIMGFSPVQRRERMRRVPVFDDYNLDPTSATAAG